MKIIFTLVIAASFANAGLAQQATQYSLYMWNKYAFNPAYAGLDNSLSITGVYRNQWAGLAGNPTTQAINVHLPLYIAGGGVGFGVENETIGSWKQTTTTVGYDYQLIMGKSGILSLGLNAGFLQREINGSKLRTPGGVYEEDGTLIAHNDQILSEGVQKGSAPTLQIGAFFQGEKLEIGVSATNLLENEVSLSTITFKPERTYYLYLGHQFDLGKKLTVSPSALLKTSVAQTQVDLSVLVRYDENIFAGASFRGLTPDSRDATVLFGGFKLSEKYTVGYAYDLTLSGLRTVNSGTHELVLNYNLGKEIGKGRPPKIIYNPRSL